MSDDRERRIALILQALEALERDRTEYMTEHKDQRTKLENQLAALRDEILSNQVPLPLEAA